MKMKCTLAIFQLICVLLFTGCSNIPYYIQSIQGHSEVLLNRQSIDDVLKQAPTAELEHKLTLVKDLLNFAEHELLLPNNGSYQHYADIKRPYVVWNVFATPEFSFTPQTWCYAFVGCLSYRGYYNKESADQLATELSEQNMDVFVGSVTAYSTLGWFDDPILNTMIRYDDLYLARIIFHELTHQKIYLKNDSEFNEAFADSIAMIGLDMWLQQTNQSPLYKDLLKEQHYEEEFVSLLFQYKKKLEVVYDSKINEKSKREKKQSLLKQFKTDYEILSQNWDGYKGFDNWFKKPLNNARFSAVSTYRELVPEFIELYQTLNEDLSLFYQTVKKLDGCSKQQRREYLKRKHEPVCKK